MAALGPVTMAQADSLRLDGAPDDTPQKPAPAAFNAREPTRTLNWGSGESRSFWVPALEIPAFELLLNRYDHYALDAATYPSPITNFRTNLHRSWVIDNDKFSTNQFCTPIRDRSIRAWRARRALSRHLGNLRHPRHTHLPDSHQNVRTVNIGYTLLGHTRFGAVDWRDD